LIDRSASAHGRDRISTNADPRIPKAEADAWHFLLQSEDLVIDKTPLPHPDAEQCETWTSFLVGFLFAYHLIRQSDRS